jgi:hypothetical protein
LDLLLILFHNINNNRLSTEEKDIMGLKAIPKQQLEKEVSKQQTKITKNPI